MTRLTDLPIEIQTQIYQQLCLHCLLTSETDFCFYTLPERHQLGHARLPQDLGADLKSLCLTCRQLRTLAQPVLFHWISGRWEQVPNLLLLLAARPELGCQVKMFHPRLGTKAGDLILPILDIDWVNRLIRMKNERDVTGQAGPLFWYDLLDSDLDDAESRCLATVGQSEKLPEIPYLHLTGDADDAAILFNRDYWDIFGPLYVLLCHMIPNVEYLHCLEVAMDYVPKLGHPTSLPRLKQLLVRQKVPLANVFAMAPHLTALTAYNFHLSDNADVENKLTTVRLLQTLIEATDLRNLFLLCTRLISFSGMFNHVDVHPNTPTPRRVSEAVLLRKDTLQELQLSFSIFSFERRRHPQESLLGTLQSMEVLRTVEIDANELLHPNHARAPIWADTDSDAHSADTDSDSNPDSKTGNEEPRAYGMEDAPMNITTDNTEMDFQEAESLLAEFLPSSIESLTIYPPTTSLVHALIVLLRQAPESFPNLRHLWVPGLRPKSKAMLSREFLPTTVKFRGRPRGKKAARLKRALSL